MKNNLIRCFLLSGMMLLVSSITYSQHNKVPPFQMIQANGKVFLAGNLPLEKPIVIIYFSPECEDCQQLTKELLNRIKEFNNVSIAMITNLSIDKVKQFVTEYHLDKYSNIFIGTEGNSFFVGNYYSVGKLPFMALYNKNGDLIKVYNKEISIEDLLIHLRDL
jgi:thiol-disulfide isomerase/thioredoxin